MPCDPTLYWNHLQCGWHSYRIGHAGVMVAPRLIFNRKTCWQDAGAPGNAVVRLGRVRRKDIDGEFRAESFLREIPG